jgi:hypothetical protein
MEVESVRSAEPFDSEVKPQSSMVCENCGNKPYAFSRWENVGRDLYELTRKEKRERDPTLDERVLEHTTHLPLRPGFCEVLLDGRAIGWARKYVAKVVEGAWRLESPQTPVAERPR